MTETLKIMRAWDRGRNKIAYVYRDSETGKTKIGETKFQNWFYLKQKDFQEQRSLLYRFKEENTITGFEDVGKYVKVFVDTVHNDELMNKDMEWVWEYKNFKTNKMLEQLKMIGVQTYEADVKAYKRWLLQESVEIEREYKIMYFDIETDDRHADGLTPGKYRILSCAVKLSDNHNADGKMYWVCTEEDTDEAEKAMLEKLAKLINANDVIISFNGMNFDDPYIKSRFVRYGIQIDWRKKFLQDHYWTFKKYDKGHTSYSLDSLAKTILLRGKVEHVGMRIWDMWESNRKLLKEYNIEDVQLMFELECKTGYLSAHRDICAEGMCPVDDLYVSRKIDNFILKQAEEDNEFHFKTVERRNRRK
jgi:DNA polymerase elongation subunit (family B)